MSVHAWVFVAYFAAVFGIGWLSMLKTRDEADYWIAGGELGWFTGGSTLAATHVSAGTFVGTVGVIYTAGWSFGWVLLSIPLAYWFVAAALAPRFTKVRQLTLPAFMEARYYSKKVRGISAAIALIATVVYIQAQIVAGGLVANIVFGVPEAWGMVAFTAILLAYTVVGGMIAVVWTDTFQLVIMVLGAVLALPLAIRQAGGPSSLLGLAEAARPTVFQWGNLPNSLLFTMALAFFLGSIATPEKLTRLYSMKDLPTIRRGVFFATVCITGLNLMVFVIGLAAIVLFPGLPKGDLAMPMVATAVLPPLLGALMLAAIASAMMSTVSSLLIVAGSALAVDLYQNLLHPGVSPGRRRWVDRLGILIVGTVPVLLLLSGVGTGELVQFIVLLFIALMASSFCVPVVGGVYWRRATREGAAAGMLGGITAAFLWKALGPESIDAVVPGFLTSLVLWWGVSLLTPPPPVEAVAPYFPAVPDPETGA